MCMCICVMDSASPMWLMYLVEEIYVCEWDNCGQDVSRQNDFKQNVILSSKIQITKNASS